jgi:negative regulator of replication initiation
MKTIKISEEVWQAIAAKGKFGETENDVLERVLNIQSKSFQQQDIIKLSKRRNKFADQRMSTDVLGNTLHVCFQDGSSKKWTLSDPVNKVEIRRIRDEAVNFAKQNNASYGQEQAVKKALTNAGYWLNK